MDTVTVAITAAEALQKLGGWLISVVLGVVVAAQWRAHRADNKENTQTLLDLTKSSTVVTTEMHKVLTALAVKMDYVERANRGRE